MSLLIIHVSQQRALTDSQKLLIDMYYNDGHSYEFLQSFFHDLFEGQEGPVDEYLDELYAPKLLIFVAEEIEE